MKRIITPFIFPVLLLLFACNESHQKTNRQELVVTRSSDSLRVHNIILPDDSGHVFLDLERGHIKRRIRKQPGQTVTLEFTRHDSARVYAWLTSEDSLANIHFSKIIMPNDRYTGPFEKILKYDLLQEGIYRITVDEDRTAGGPWGGVFQVKLELGH